MRLCSSCSCTCGCSKGEAAGTIYSAWVARRYGVDYRDLGRTIPTGYGAQKHEASVSDCNIPTSLRTGPTSLCTGLVHIEIKAILLLCWFNAIAKSLATCMRSCQSIQNASLTHQMSQQLSRVNSRNHAHSREACALNLSITSLTPSISPASTPPLPPQCSPGTTFSSSSNAG